ncbi:sorting nexin lst-4 isoform X2 [Tenebrio molitor]|uniref:sorting nexin lst-4 isoform X2 n=1 Tax=Tenebrio molitor TaxID=7067 RepID=UPI003624AAAB
MALFRVQALYDFVGESNSAELSITAGETLSVTRVDIGEGWWEGTNSQGQSGLFPQAYVSKLEDSAPPSIPPPALPPQASDWTPGGSQQDDDWDDEWDNDDTYSEIANNAQRESHYSNEPNQNQYNYGSGQVDNISESTLKDVPPHTRVKIFRENENVFRWELIAEPYTVQVTSPKKASKMGGLKSFIAYQLTPSFTGIEVSRRYKHFDWLHNRLSDKFNILAMPPLPDKQISGRYEEHFIEHRRVQLQEFVNYVCRHPVLSACEVWQHFLTCTNEKQWKEGKRRAEKDQLVGANFCLCVEAPDKDLLASTIESKIDNSISYINQMDQSVKGLMQTAADQQKKCENLYKREHTKVGESFFSLGVAFENREGGLFSDLATDMKKIGTTYIEIAKLYEDQGKIDWQPLTDKLYLYRGVTSSYPDIFSMQKHAEQKKKECERNSQMSHGQITEVRKRTDALTYSVFAELDHFQSEMNTEFKSAMKSFLQEQVNFYKNIVSRLEDTLKRFE